MNDAGGLTFGVVVLGLAVVWAILSISGCSTVNINCNYFKLVDHTLVNTCVEEHPGAMPIHRGSNL